MRWDVEKEKRKSRTRKKRDKKTNLVFFFSLLQGGKMDLNTTLPIRQTASIFKQPITKVTTHPGNKVKTDLQRATEQPRQVRKRVCGAGSTPVGVTWQVCLSVAVLGEKVKRSAVIWCHRRSPENHGSAQRAAEWVCLRKLNAALWGRIQCHRLALWPLLLFKGVGPDSSDDILLSAIASALHMSSSPITGQMSVAAEKNPAIWLNTSQPLCRAFTVTDEHIRWEQKRGDTAVKV